MTVPSKSLTIMMVIVIVAVLLFGVMTFIRIRSSRSGDNCDMVEVPGGNGFVVGEKAPDGKYYVRQCS